MPAKPKRPVPRRNESVGVEITPKRYGGRINGFKADPYRIITLYGITHPALQHAIKKLLRAGKDPHQSEGEDVDEVIGALLRWKEMKLEEQDENIFTEA